MWLSPARVPPWPSSAPDAVKMPWWSLSSPPLPLPTFHLRKHLAKVCSLEEVKGINLPECRATFLTPRQNLVFFFCHCESCWERTLYLVCLGAFVRRSGGIDCARIFACSQDRGRQCPVLVVAITAKPKGSGLCQGLNKAWGFVPDIPSLVCVCACVFVSGDWWSAGRLGLEARSSRWR